MEERLVGRKDEQEALRQCMSSGKAELIAVYGRRRVGKTFLVRQFFKGKFDFYVTGVDNGSKQEQLTVFNQALIESSGNYFPPVSNWMDAFAQLRAYLTGLNKSRLLLFIDELPWLDTPRSRFMQAFEYFWNSWASTLPGLKLVVCGSATTWMVRRFLGHRGGLHNRTTRRIHLRPFSLDEVSQYLQMHGIELSRYQIVETYMIFGGIPYYLSLLQRGLSVSQNVDRLLFGPTAELRDEYQLMMRSLFSEAETYRQMVEFMSTKGKGFTRGEIAEGLAVAPGGFLSTVLQNLENCDFIRKYYPFGKKERDALYQLCDPFLLFYLRHVKPAATRDEHYWTNLSPTPAHNAWSGYAFEMVCLLHVEQIKRALGISGVQCNVCSWVGKGAQVDLLLDRRDGIVNVCEMKYSQQPYVITKAYSQQLQDKLLALRMQTSTRKALHLTMVTTYGLFPNQYSADVQRQVTIDDLFS